MNQEEYLKDRLDDQINWYDKKSAANQSWFKRLQVLIIVASASIPFLSGYLDDMPFVLTLVIGLLGLLIAASTAILGLYQFQENWLEYRTTCESLKHEKFRFMTSVGPYAVEKPFPVLVERVEALISKENTNWSNYMRATDDEAGTAE